MQFSAARFARLRALKSSLSVRARQPSNRDRHRTVPIPAASVRGQLLTRRSCALIASAAVVGLSLASRQSVARASLAAGAHWFANSASNQDSPTRRQHARGVSHTTPSTMPLYGSSPEPTMDSLVSEMQREGRVKSSRVADAMRRIDRRHFVVPGTPDYAIYTDAPLPIGHDQTISAPHMHASCLDLLEPWLKEGAKVLDAGSGSGYLTAVMGVLVGSSGRVMGVEKWAALAADSVRNVMAAAPELLQSGRVSLEAGNVLEEGKADQVGGPFDAIHVGAAASNLPATLVTQLKPGGRMVIPVGPQGSYQVLQVVDKDQQGRVTIEDLMYVRYVPLTKPHESPGPVA